MPDQLASSPLKVVVSKRGSIMTATDPAGNVVLDGVRGKRAKPLAAVQTTAANRWTIEHRSKGSAPVYDSAGVAVAEIRRIGMFRNDVIVTGDGSEIEVAKRTRSISFGSLATAKPALLRSGSTFELAVSDELLARPDREMLIAVFTHVARQKIDTDNAVDATFVP